MKLPWLYDFYWLKYELRRFSISDLWNIPINSLFLAISQWKKNIQNRSRSTCKHTAIQVSVILTLSENILIITRTSPTDEFQESYPHSYAIIIYFSSGDTHFDFFGHLGRDLDPICKHASGSRGDKKSAERGVALAWAKSQELEI